MSRYAPRYRAFTLLELLMALLLVAVLMAAISPALVGALNAQTQVRSKLLPMGEENAAIGVLRDDLASAPRPRGNISRPLVVTPQWLGSRSATTLSFGASGSLALSDAVAKRDPGLGLYQVDYTLSEGADPTAGLTWQRSVQPHLLAVGVPPTPTAEILLEHLAFLQIEVLVGDAYEEAYDSDDHDAVLPKAIRVSYALLDAKGVAGPERVLVLDLPQVALDPLQQESP